MEKFDSKIYILFKETNEAESLVKRAMEEAKGDKIADPLSFHFQTQEASVKVEIILCGESNSHLRGQTGLLRQNCSTPQREGPLASHSG